MRSAGWPSHRASVRSRSALPGAIALVWYLLSAAATAQDVPRMLTLPEALEGALRNHPQIAAFPLDRAAAEGRLLQASLRPNPELSVELENIGGDFRGLDRSETTVALTQLLEIGKRTPRIREAESGLGRVRSDFEALRWSILSDVRIAFVALLGAQKKLELTREAHRIASLLASAVTERVAAGAVSPIEETRARIALAAAASDLARAEKERAEARNALAEAVAESPPAGGDVSGELAEDPPVPDWASLVAGLSRNPELARVAAEKLRREAALDAERSRAVPDVTLQAGYRRFNESSESAFIAGASVPIPLLGRNQGAIREARARLARTELERRDAERKLASQLALWHSNALSAGTEARLLKAEALANAESAFEAVNEGYRLGKFRYLDVLDAGRSLLEIRLRHAEAVAALNLALARIESLAPGPETTGSVSSMETK